MFENLPDDMKNLIKSFLYGNCVNCRHEKLFYQLKHNIALKEYKSVFSDEYYWYSMEWYKLICSDCIDNLYHFENKIICYI